ncbi:formate dehydrogenase accessory sulfurtransferase FdhD [Rhodalgimonas zhirmunskyi]|uniref:Sulfur carrier protein FdhD n=1 Tax=Rhodalgimonas zhirmunskyi TaxID=2964767 RepID=A0AAJ1UAQ0_9RHOB|nr:formate dehydrogenase accessory sulfurtransferase FdhD [Rhodoalgimonas zhirmunskyi]MDQ2095945.1 formate dehydrogenase accessory sulfurtransferase FdhD [Rhodoalgimonas zhirmunskyi]
MARAAISLGGVSHRGEGRAEIRRSLPEEVPVAMVFDGSTVGVMMATPSDLVDFAQGFALSEGIIDTLDEIERFELLEHERGIEARFWLAKERSEALKQRRRAMMGPVGCGLCGIDSLEQAMRDLPVLHSEGPHLSPADIMAAPEALRAHQPLHDKTRAVHAAGALLPGGGILMAREDVGRHNALDKLIGALARERAECATLAVVMTSRLSVELVQKCAVVGIPVLIGVSSPTAHAQRLAEGAGMTLVGFARDTGFDVFAGAQRIKGGADGT